MKQHDLRVGIVGAHRGRSYIPGYNGSGHSRVVAVCDLNPQTLNETADAAGAELRYSNYDEMLDRARLDIVVVATPMPLHVPQSIAALQRNIHVMSDVPAATDLEQCWQLVQAVRAAPNAKYMMAENCCYMPFFVTVRAMVDAGLFGDLYFAEGAYIHEIKARVMNPGASWRRFWQTGIDGNTYSTHSLGPPLHWMRTRVATVTCVGSGRHFSDASGKPFAQDTTITFCKTEHGGMISLRTDLLSDRGNDANFNTYSLQGTRGCFEIPRGPVDERRVWLKTEGDARHDRPWRSLKEFEKDFLPETYRNLPDAAKEAGHDGSDYFQVIDFIDCIYNDRKSPIDAYEGLDITLPGLVSQESIRRGGAPLPVPDFRKIAKFPHDLPAELKESFILRVRDPGA